MHLDLSACKIQCVKKALKFQYLFGVQDLVFKTEKLGSFLSAARFFC
jgi:hypothetical protein